MMDNDALLRRGISRDHLHRARVILDFLSWSKEQHGRRGTYFRDGGYEFRRSISVCGHHEYEIVGEEDLAKLIIRFLEEDR